MERDRANVLPSDTVHKSELGILTSISGGYKTVIPFQVAIAF